MLEPRSRHQRTESRGIVLYDWDVFAAYAARCDCTIPFGCFNEYISVASHLSLYLSISLSIYLYLSIYLFSRINFRLFQATIEAIRGLAAQPGSNPFLETAAKNPKNVEYACLSIAPESVRRAAALKKQQLCVHEPNFSPYFLTAPSSPVCQCAVQSDCDCWSSTDTAQPTSITQASLCVMIS